MNVPNIRYYARFAETTAEGKKTPKYTIVEAAGHYLIKSLAWYRCSTLMVPCATLSRYRSYHSLGTGTTEVI